MVFLFRLPLNILSSSKKVNAFGEGYGGIRYDPAAAAAVAPLLS